MAKKYNKLQADSFVEKFARTNSIEGMLYNFTDLGKAIKFFADKKDEVSFNKAADKFFGTVNSYAKDDLKRDSYKFYESLCYNVDGRIKIEKGKVANLYDWIMSREGKAVKLYKKYLKTIEVKHNIKGYSAKEVYEKVDNLSKGLARLYINFVPNVKKTWNGKRNRMNFKFKIDDFPVKGNIVINKNELTLNGRIPLEAKLYREDITRDIKKKLERVLPKLSL